VPNGGVDRLLRHLDSLGIARAVCFAPFAFEVGGDLRRANEWLLEQIKRRPELVPFATVNPVHPDAVAVLEAMAEAGVRGCKIHPSVDVYDLVDSRARDFYTAAAERGILLDFHVGAHGSPLALSDPVKLDTILWEYSTLRLVLEHAGGRLYYETAIAIAANHSGERPRAFIGITSVLEREANFLWYLGPERVRELIEGVGAGQLVFGLDFPWWTIEQNRKAIAALRRIDVPESEQRLVFGGTLDSLLQDAR
jgi:predicted TIM-barrel fold metal-dependent hydrolase